MNTVLNFMKSLQPFLLRIPLKFGALNIYLHNRKVMKRPLAISFSFKYFLCNTNCTLKIMKECWIYPQNHSLYLVIHNHQLCKFVCIYICAGNRFIYLYIGGFILLLPSCSCLLTFFDFQVTNLFWINLQEKKKKKT